MKTNFKRLFALLLTLCMLASLMVPVAFAEDVATEAPSANVAETYPIRLKDLNNTDANAAVEGTHDYLMTKLDLSTTEDETDRTWNTDFSAGRFAAAYKDRLVNWDVYAKGGTVSYKSDRAWQVRVDNGAWAAVKIRVSNPGVYALTMTTDRGTYENYENLASGATSATEGTVSAYIIPLSVADAAESVADLMTDKYFVGSDYLALEDTAVTFDKVRMDEYEYVVVFSSTGNRYTLAEMSLVGEAYEKREVKSYDLYPFDLSLPYADWAAHAANKYLVTETVTNNEDGTITGLVQNTNKGNTYANSGWAFYDIGNGKHYHRINTMYQYQVNTRNTLAAFKLNVPESGAMYLSMTTDKSAVPEHLANYVDSKSAHITNGADDWTGTVKAYLVPLSVMTEATADGTAAKTAAANLTADDTYFIGSRKLLTDETTVTFDKTDMEAGEYILIYTADASLYATSEIKLEALAVDAIPENNYATTQEISYKLYNIDDSVFNQIEGETITFATELSDGNGGTTNLQDYVAALYAEGKLDWKIEAYPATFTSANFVSEKAHDRGIEVSTPGTTASNSDPALDTDWFAIRFRVKDAGYYSITPQMKMVVTPGLSAYLIPAAAETMTADEIQAQIVPENGLAFFNMDETTNDPVSVGYLEGEYIIAYKAPYAKTRTFTVQGILLESEAPLSADDVQFYNFDLYDETNCYYPLMTDVYSAVTDETTGVTTFEKKDFLAEGSKSNWRDYEGLVLTRDEDGNVTSISTGSKGAYAYDAVLKADGSGYPNTLNWRPDYLCSASTTDQPKLGLFTNGGDYGGGVNFTDGGESTYIASYTLRVDKAGTYDLNIAAGLYDYAYDIYFVDTMLTNYNTRLTATTVANYTAAESPWLLGNVQLNDADTVKAGTVTVDAAGDYVIIFKTTLSNKDLYLDSITLTPVVEEIAAVVAGQNYATFAEAVAAAAGGDTITLMDNVITDEVVLGSGVTLNLMGYSIYADVIDATAPGAKIVDPSDGGAALFADEVIFDEVNNNPQLPLKDKTTGAYHLFNVDVEPVTITGANSASPKYWFKVSFSNKDALDIITFSTELRIQANLNVAGTEALASADAAFSASWADKYAANDGVYITVSAINADAAYTLAPQVAANGVVIAGSAMELPTAEVPAPEETPAE